MTDPNQPIKITPKQLEILYQLYRFRFLSRPHIQYLLKHKEPRRINSWLKTLTQHQLINRIYTRDIGSHTKPAIYYLHTNSLAYLQNHQDVNHQTLNRFYREKQRTQKFIARCLCFADYYIKTHRRALANQEELTYYTKINLEDFGFVIRPLPDACVVLHKGKTAKRSLVELIPEGMPRYAITKRIEQFVEYFNSGDWDEGSGYEFPEITLIAGNGSIERMLKRQAKKIWEEESEEIRFTIKIL